MAGLRQLKKEDGPDLVIYGSSKLIQTLLANDLVDKLLLWIFPVTIGKGKRLFSEGARPGDWKLLDSKTSTTGVIIASYEPAGEITLGSLALEEPTAAELARRKRLAEEG